MNVLDEFRQEYPNARDDVVDGLKRQLGQTVKAEVFGEKKGREQVLQESTSDASKAVPKIAGASKYHNQRTVYNGVTYHSAKEASKAAELDMLVKAGEIDYWLRQVPFIVGYDPMTIYVADFMTFQRIQGLWHIEVIEIKPKSEAAWAKGAKRKLKLFRQ